MMKKVIFAIAFLFALNLQAQQNKPNSTSFEKIKKASNNFTYKIINSPNNTFGYDIYNAGKMMIHQPTPPGVSGNNGFKKKKDAESVAKFVIEKMKKGEMPPTVTTEDFKKMKIVF